jgi:hypothetical protein
VIRAEETGPVMGITPAAAEPRQASEGAFAADVGRGPTGVMEVALVTCQ